MRKIENLPTGDKRLAELYESLSDFLFENAYGLPIPSIVGVLVLVQKDIMEDGRE